MDETNSPDDFVTAIRFYQPYELAVPRARLESEGIECRVLDELTVQVNPFYSNAIGGIKLQVREKDLEQARAILKEGGYLKDEVPGQPWKFPPWAERVLSGIPLLNRFRIEIRLLIVVVFLGLVISGLIYVSTLPSTKDKITANEWCVYKTQYQGRYYTSHTIESLRSTFSGDCDETARFDRNGYVLFPGFNSRAPSGQWDLDGDVLTVSSIDTFGFVYNGSYRIEFDRGDMILASDSTIIYMHPGWNM